MSEWSFVAYHNNSYQFEQHWNHQGRSKLQCFSCIARMARSPTQLNINVQPLKEIRFSGDFREMIVQTLEIKNPGKDVLYFKVKTTSPHRYVVKPHKGEIEGKGQVQIAVTLLPFLYKPDYSYRDKFLLQVIFIFCPKIQLLKRNCIAVNLKIKIFPQKFKYFLK